MIAQGQTAPSEEEVEGLALVAGEFLAAVILVLVLALVLVWATLRAARREPAAAVPVIVGLLTYVAILGYLFVRAEVLAGLAATGLGALAGAVTSLFDRRGGADQDDEPPAPPAPPAPPQPPDGPDPPSSL